MKKILPAIFLAVLLAALVSGLTLAQARVPTDDEVNAVAHELYCPVCQNTPLDVCPTDACHDWREQIRGMLAEGKTKEEIHQYFVNQFGDRVLAAPPTTTGFNYIIYILPPLIILAGAVILFRSLKQWTAPRSAAESPAPEAAAPAQDDYVARLEEELKKQK